MAAHTGVAVGAKSQSKSSAGAGGGAPRTSGAIRVRRASPARREAVMASPAAHQRDARAAKIAEYERFIGERLQPDLAAAEAAKAKTQLETDRWEALVSNARGVRERGQEELRTMVDLGSQVYCQAEVADTSRLFVAVGLGFHAEMTLDEAESFAERKIASLADEMRRRVEEVANVQSHIKLVAEGIRELMMLSPEPDAHRRGAGGFGNAAAF